FQTAAETASFWTRRHLELETDPDARNQRWQFLGGLKIRQDFHGILCVHGSPRRPINEYIFADDVVTAPSKMQQIFQRFDHLCLVGHTHTQGVFTDEPDFYAPDELNYTYKFREREKAVINVGSVGQPRDRDPRAAYGILYDDRVEFVRLEYDIAAVIKKIDRITELSEFFGHRLLEGR
ncbi:MAG: phosphoesterase, partial [Planctomycetaceae bacterium]|nr:phosphoesterase [Planctomycetaceae bacterium]